MSKEIKAYLLEWVTRVDAERVEIAQTTRLELRLGHISEQFAVQILIIAGFPTDRILAILREPG